MDQSTLLAYALAYLAAMGTVFLMFLPFIISFVLLLLVGGTIQVVILILRLTVVGLFRSVRALTGGLIDKLHRPGSGGRLAHH